VVGNSFLTRSGRPFSTLQRKVGTREIGGCLNSWLFFATQYAMTELLLPLRWPLPELVPVDLTRVDGVVDTAVRAHRSYYGMG